MSTMTTTPARDAVLSVISEAGTVRTATLPRLVTGYSARQLSNALTSLFHDGLIDAPAGRYGEYRLTEKGEAAATELPKTNYLELVTPHPGGSAYHPETGDVAIGVGRNGELRYWNLWTGIGARPGLVVGATGSGGTNLLSGLIEATLPHPQVRTWVVDTEHQLAEYWTRVDRIGILNPADYPEYVDPQPTSTAALLDQVIAVQHDRQRLLAKLGYRSWQLATGLPLGLLVISSLNEISHSRDLSDSLTVIARLARKTGISIVTHAHSPLLDSFGNALLQDYFGGGNLALMRMASKPFGRVISPELANLPVISSTFADGSTTAGLGYGEDGAMFRSFWASGL